MTFLMTIFQQNKYMNIKRGQIIGVDLYVGKHDNTGVPNLVHLPI